MDNFIILFIFVANVIATILLYYSFDKNLGKQKKIFYTVIGIGTMYIIIALTYFLSSIGIDKEKTRAAKDMITMCFVPVNTIIFLPLLINWYKKYRKKEIKEKELNKRTVILGIIAIIIIVSEFLYFRNFQKNIIEMIDIANKNNIIQNNEVINNMEENNINNNEIINSIEENTISNNSIINNNEATNNINNKKNENNIKDNNTIN